MIAAEPGSRSAEAEYLASPVVAPNLASPGGKPCADTAPGAEEVAASLSRVRAMAGLPPLDCAPRLEAAATAHAGYMAMNGEFGHVEIEGHAGFTGETPRRRVERVEFEGETGGEVVSQQQRAPSIDSAFGYMNSVYHRAMLLRIETTTFGYGESGAGSVLELGRREDAHQQAQEVIWPPDGATNVPTTFHAASELPNPVAPLEVAGSPISLITGHPLEGLSGKITGPDGAVDAELITAKSDSAKLVRAGEAHLVPRSPLSPNTEYFVQFTFREGAATITSESSFVTAAR